MKIHQLFTFTILFTFYLVAGFAFAHEDSDDNRYRAGNVDCPVNYFDAPYGKKTPNGEVIVTPPAGGLTIDEEFGYGSEAITNCLKVRNNAKVVISITGAHPSDKNGNIQLDKARFLSNIEYFRENYEDVHDMKIGKDVKVVAVAGSSGALLMTTQHPAWAREKTDPSEPTCMDNETQFAGKTCTNPFRALVERAQDIGVKFYLCQMASRVLSIKKPNVIPGVEFVPGAHIAVADFQLRGYALIDL
ncbi:MAG: DsrE family protein [Gammaproteobacteria bacterium]|jgi:intracellular sulfur oxidation DsrE/DsrF family protein